MTKRRHTGLTPPLSNRGSQDYIKPQPNGPHPPRDRVLPDVHWQPAPAGNFLLAHGYDYWQEAYNRKILPSLYDRLEKWQRDARALDPRSGQPVTAKIGGEEFQISPTGAAGGIQYFAQNEVCILFFRSPNCPWPLSVRYLAAGIWQLGLAEIRARVGKLIERIGVVENPEERLPRLSRADYAFDFFAPAFTPEMQPEIIRRFISPAPLKNRGYGEANFVGKAGRLETVTLGKFPGLQISVYDKSREITEVSGKDWMLELYRRNCPAFAPSDPLRDIWRLEIRFGKEYLKMRNIRHAAEFQEDLPRLIAGALINRRLLSANVEQDSNRTRHEGHWLWALAYEASGKAGTTPAIGKCHTLRRDAMSDLVRTQIAGSLRAASAISTGKVERRTIDREIQAVLSKLDEEPAWLKMKKDRRAVERYRNLRDLKS